MAIGRRTTTSRTQDEAGRALWDAHYPALTAWLVTLVGDREVAHDLSSEAFVKVLTRWRTVREPKAFLYAVAANLAKDHWRREQRDRRLVDRVAEVTPTTTSPSDPWLRDLVERLPDKLRLPVLLHYYADLPVAEVAAALGKPEGTVKAHLVAGRAALLSAAHDAVKESDR